MKKSNSSAVSNHSELDNLLSEDDDNNQDESKEDNKSNKSEVEARPCAE